VAAAKVVLTFRPSHDVQGQPVLNVYHRYGNGPDVIAGTLRISKTADKYLERLANGRKQPKALSFKYIE
jgi:hypothetical protein